MTRSGSCAAWSGPSWTARWTWACIPPRTCPPIAREAIRLVGVPKREEPVDAFVGSEVIARGAARRIEDRDREPSPALAALALRPDLEPVELHGNVDTRLRKLAEGEYDGIILAAAGLRRLGRDAEVTFRFGLEELTPAGGQGSLALEARRGDARAAEEAARISSHDALVELTAERAALTALGASCDTPVGICARLDPDELEMFGYAGLPDGSDWVRDRLSGDPEQPAALGEALAERMLLAGAGQILQAAAAAGDPEVAGEG